MPSSSGRNTTRAREAGAASRRETRRRLLEAAGQEFETRGYTAATVARIAETAGVSVQTLYLAWGSKRELLRAYMEAALAGQPETPYAQELPHMISDAIGDAPDDPRAILEHVAHLYRTIAERAAPGWLLYRDAAATDPQVAHDWLGLQRLRQNTFTTLISHLPAHSLRPGLTPEAAAQTAWAIASPETYDLLVRTAGYSLDKYETWIATTLAAALLPDSASRNRP